MYELKATLTTTANSRACALLHHYLAGMGAIGQLDTHHHDATANALDTADIAAAGIDAPDGCTGCGIDPDEPHRN